MVLDIHSSLHRSTCRRQNIACNGTNMVLDSDYIGRLVADIGLLDPVYWNRQDVLDCHRDPSPMAGRCRFGSRPGYCREDIVGGQGRRFFVVDAVISPVSNSVSKTFPKSSAQPSPSEGPSAQRATPSAPTRRGRPELMWGSTGADVGVGRGADAASPSAQPLSSASCAPWQVAPSCPRLRAPHIATPEQMWGSDKEPRAQPSVHVHIATPELSFQGPCSCTAFRARHL